MTERVTIDKAELDHLEERSRKCSMDKAYLQLVIRLMNQVSAASGLDDTVDAMLRNVLEVIGGANIVLYYWVGNDVFYADVYGKKCPVETIEDGQVQQVAHSRQPLEVEHDFSDSLMLTPEFGKSYTWVYPLLVGGELVGVFKMEHLHMAMRELYSYLPTFFNFVALAMKSEILGFTQLKQAYDRLSESNVELTREIEERKRAEAELIKARSGLEEKVAQRTDELRGAYQRLQLELKERERAEEVQRRYAEELQDLYECAPCGYHSLDKNGLFLRINDTELNWLGYTREEVVGKLRFTDLVTEESRAIFRENFPKFMAQGWIKDLEFEMIRKDGSRLCVLLTGTAVREGEEFMMSRSTLYDITELKKAREKEHLLSAIVQSSDDAIVAKDLEGSILSWNRGAESIYGYGADEALGKSIAMLFPPAHRDELARIMARVAGGEEVEHCTTRRVRKDGRVISVSLTVSPIRDASGRVVGASSIAHDITEQVRAEEEIVRLNKELEERVAERTDALEAKQVDLVENQKALMNIVEDLNQKTGELQEANARLQELERLKAMFIASMSHELRTPLNSIIGFSSIILDEWLGPVNREQQENLATILRSGKHLLSLINDVIDVSKIESGKVERRLEEFDLYDLLTEAANYLEKDIAEKGLRLDLTLEHQIVYSERRRLLQCVINLLSNALKFTESGEIRMESSREEGADEGSPQGGRVAIAVRDTGIGIAEGDIPKLCQPFVRLDSPLKTAVPGTGLGLYLTRKLVDEVLGGTMSCISSLGVGSTFTIRIPERADEKETGSPLPTPPRPSLPLS